MGQYIIKKQNVRKKHLLVDIPFAEKDKLGKAQNAIINDKKSCKFAMFCATKCVNSKEFCF